MQARTKLNMAAMSSAWSQIWNLSIDPQLLGKCWKNHSSPFQPLCLCQFEPPTPLSTKVAPVTSKPGNIPWNPRMSIFILHNFTHPALIWKVHPMQWVLPSIALPWLATVLITNTTKKTCLEYMHWFLTECDDSNVTFDKSMPGKKGLTVGFLGVSSVESFVQYLGTLLQFR